MSMALPSLNLRTIWRLAVSQHQRTELITALRSGKYKQTIGELRKGDCFCVLGVICDLYDPKQWDVDGCYLNSFGAFESFGVPGNLQAELIYLNDEAKKTFPEIADWLEKTCTS